MANSLVHIIKQISLLESVYITHQSPAVHPYTQPHPSTPVNSKAAAYVVITLYFQVVAFA